MDNLAQSAGSALSIVVGIGGVILVLLLVVVILWAGVVVLCVVAGPAEIALGLWLASAFGGNAGGLALVVFLPLGIFTIRAQLKRRREGVVDWAIPIPFD